MSMISEKSAELVNFMKVASSFVRSWRSQFSGEDNVFPSTIVACFLALRKQDLLVDNMGGRDTLMAQVEKIRDYLHTESVPRSTTIALNICLDNILEILSLLRLDNADILASMSHCVYTIADTSILNNAFDFIVNRCYIKDNTVHKECFSIPSEMAELAVRLLDVKDGESICNPYAGVATCASYLPETINYIGQEKNTELYKLAVLRLFLLGRDVTLMSNAEPLGLLVDGEVEDAHYLMIPPFSYEEHIDWTDNYNKVQHKQDRVSNAEVIAYDHLLYNCEQSSCIIMPASVLSNRNKVYQTLRRKYTTEPQSYKIILLPSGLYAHSGTQMAMLIVGNINEENGTFTFVDASDCYTNGSSTINQLDVEKVLSLVEDCPADKVIKVNASDISEKDFFSWNPITYLRKNELSHLPEGYESVPLKDLIYGIYSQDIIPTDDYGHVVRYSDLKNDSLHVYEYQDFPEKNIPTDSYKLTASCLLLSLVKDFRPTFVEADEEHPLYVSRSIAAIILDYQKINPLYLVHRLRQVPKDIYFVGVVIPRIRLQDLYEIEIPVCAREMQDSMISELKEQEKQALIKQANLTDIIDQMKTDYINEVRSRKHDMMPHLRQLSSSRKNLWYYLNHRDEFSEQEFISGMRAEVSNQKNAIEELTYLLSLFSRESRFGKPEIINIYDYFVNHYFDGDDYIVDFIPDNVALQNYGFENTGEEYDVDKIDGFRLITGFWYHFKGTNVRIAPDDLKRLCDNIVSNAITHGFADSTDPHCIEIRLSVDQEHNMFLIYFTNDGNPLPQGMDKLRYGLRGEKAGPTGGTGEGGYIVKSIVEHYDGDYDIFSNQSGETVVGIALPIYRSDE